MSAFKRILNVVIFFLVGSYTSDAQDVRYGNWLLESLIVDNQSIELPDNYELSAIYLLFENNGEMEPDGMIFQACRFAYHFISFNGSNGVITSIEIGPVDPSENICNLTENIEFDQKYYDFYNSSNNGIFETEIVFESNNSTLLIKSSNGDEALYRDNTLSTSSFDHSNIKIYPNPTNDIISFKISSVEIKEGVIQDMNGKIMSQFFQVESVDASHLSSGIYFLKLIDFNGGLSTIRFVKR